MRPWLAAVKCLAAALAKIWNHSNHRQCGDALGVLRQYDRVIEVIPRERREQTQCQSSDATQHECWPLFRERRISRHTRGIDQSDVGSLNARGHARFFEFRIEVLIDLAA